MGLTGQDPEETRSAGSLDGGVTGGDTSVRPLGGSMNGRRAPRTVASPPPNPVEAWYYEGMAAYQHRRWDEAFTCFMRLKEVQPSRPGLDALLDEVRWFQQLEAATPAFVEPETLAPSRAELVRSWLRKLVYVGLALLAVLALLGVASLLFVVFEGRQPWQNASNKQEIEALFSQAEERRAAGDYDGAVLAFEKLLAISPDLAEAELGIENVLRDRELAQRYAAARAAIAEEVWERARSELNAILASDPDYEDAQSLADLVARRQTLDKLYTDAGQLVTQGQWSEAIARFETMLELDASYRSAAVGQSLFDCYIYAGQELLAENGADLGALERAVDYFDRALYLKPNNPVASQSCRLGRLYLSAMEAVAGGEWVRARSQLSTLLAEAPNYAGGEAARQLYGLTVAEGQEELADGNVPAALEIFAQAQKMPVNDTSAARDGYELAKVAAVAPTPTPSPTVTVAPPPAPTPTSAPVVVPVTPRPTAPAVAPTSTPVLVSCVQGYVFNAAGGTPLREWVVTLADGTGATRTTAAGDAGHYRFDDLAPGMYRVWTTLPPGWRAISPQPAVIDLTPAEQCHPVDFWSVRERVERVPTPTPER